MVASWLCVSWTVPDDVKCFGDIDRCPWLQEWETTSYPSPEYALLAALLDGQVRGWVNHYESHYFDIKAVETNSNSMAALVYCTYTFASLVFAFKRSE